MNISRKFAWNKIERYWTEWRKDGKTERRKEGKTKRRKNSAKRWTLNVKKRITINSKTGKRSKAKRRSIQKQNKAKQYITHSCDLISLYFYIEIPVLGSVIKDRAFFFIETCFHRICILPCIPLFPMNFFIAYSS